MRRRRVGGYSYSRPSKILNGFFTAIFFFLGLCGRRATRRVERRRDSAQSQRSSHKRGDSISGGSGIEFCEAGQKSGHCAMTAKASIPAGNLAQNLLATIDASADPSRPPIHPDTLALYDLWLRRPPPRIPPWRAHPRRWKVTRSKTTKACRRSRVRLSEVVRDRRRVTALEARP